VHDHAAELLDAPSLAIPKGQQRALVEKLQSLMVTFGELDAFGRYAPTAGTAGFENAISRAGFDVLPGVAAGEIGEAIKLEDLLASEYWKQTRFYQPVDFLWQQTIFSRSAAWTRSSVRSPARWRYWAGRSTSTVR
jgi:monoamine oxidase